MPKIITMREMLAGAPTGVPGLYGIGDYQLAGLAESTWSPYDEPGRSDRLWHHKAVGDIAPSQTPPPVLSMPIDVHAIAKSMCAAAGKTWDDTAKQCLDKPAEPPKKPFWTPMTTALVALGIVGIGAVWAFGGGTKKRAKANRPRGRRAHRLRHARRPTTGEYASEILTREHVRLGRDFFAAYPQGMTHREIIEKYERGRGSR